MKATIEEDSFRTRVVAQSAARIRVMLAIDVLHIGGAEMMVRDIARALNRDRFDVCVCCTKDLGDVGRTLVADGIDTFVLPPGRKSGRADYFSSVKLRQAIVERKIDVVHTHTTSTLLDASVCRLSLPGLKVVHTFHFGNYPFASWRHHLLEGLCTRAVDKLIAVGREQRQQILATYRLSESRISVVWNGVKLPPPPSSSFRADVGTGDRLLVGSIATLTEQKGLFDLLETARLCKDAGRRMQFVIVGDGPMRPMLERRRHDLGLDDTVVLTGWIVNAATVALPAFDVFFQTSRWEAMSIAILEAMAMGKPIVATRVGDNPHVIEDGVNGVLVDTGDTAAMADALARVDDRSLREQLGAAARSRFQQEFTLDRMIDRYEGVYSEVAQRS